LLIAATLVTEIVLAFMHTWKTVTMAQRRESKFLRLHSQRPAITSLQLHWRWLFVFSEQNFPPNRFIPRMLPKHECKTAKRKIISIIIILNNASSPKG